MGLRHSKRWQRINWDLIHMIPSLGLSSYWRTSRLLEQIWLEKRRQEISVLKVVKGTTEDDQKKLAENED